MHDIWKILAKQDCQLFLSLGLSSRLSFLYKLQSTKDQLVYKTRIVHLQSTMRNLLPPCGLLHEMERLFSEHFFTYNTE